MELFSERRFILAALGHLSVDILNGGRSVLFAFISAGLGLSNTVLGVVTMLFLIAAALAQPIFGYIADRVGPRWVIAGGILWMGTFFSLAMFTPGWSSFVFLIIGSIGSGAFHPVGAAQATLIGRQVLAGREATAAAYFFLFGQLGFFIGPLVAGPVLDNFGLKGMLILSSLSLPVGLISVNVFKKKIAPTSKQMPVDNQPGKLENGVQFRWIPAIALVLIVAFQSWAAQNLTTFIPRFLIDAGRTAAYSGLISALFMAGSAVGNVVGGNLADRFGRQKIAMIALLIAGFPMLLLALAGNSPWLILIAPLSGAFPGAAFSVLVIQAQKLVPGGTSLATGLALGFMFASGAIGTLLSGQLADAQGYGSVFYLSTGLVLAAGLLSLFMEKDEKRPVSVLVTAK